MFATFFPASTLDKAVQPIQITSTRTDQILNLRMENNDDVLEHEILAENSALPHHHFGGIRINSVLIPFGSCEIELTEPAAVVHYTKEVAGNSFYNYDAVTDSYSLGTQGLRPMGKIKPVRNYAGVTKFKEWIPNLLYRTTDSPVRFFDANAEVHCHHFGHGVPMHYSYHSTLIYNGETWIANPNRNRKPEGLLGEVIAAEIPKEDLGIKDMQMMFDQSNAYMRGSVGYGGLTLHTSSGNDLPDPHELAKFLNLEYDVIDEVTYLEDGRLDPRSLYNPDKYIQNFAVIKVKMVLVTIKGFDEKLEATKLYSYIANEEILKDDGFMLSMFSRTGMMYAYGRAYPGRFHNGEEWKKGRLAYAHENTKIVEKELLVFTPRLNNQRIADIISGTLAKEKIDIFLGAQNLSCRPDNGWGDYDDDTGEYYW